MGRLAEVSIRTAIRLKNRLRASRLLGRMYRRLSQEVRYHQIFTNLPVHERMLADTARLGAYQRAIAKYVKQGDTVVDLGTGTGVLSFLAVEQRAGRIYAIDHSDIIEKARQVAAHNGLTGIEFVKANSKNFVLHEKVDVIIQEQIGTHVFDEDMVASVADLRDRLLKPGGRILPSRFEVFVEPVQIKDEYRVPFLWEQQVRGVSYACLQPWYEQQIRGGLAIGFVRPHQIDYLLCEPESLMGFDLMTVRDGDLPRKVGYRRPVSREGRLDGFCMYFRALFDDEIVLSNSPSHPQTNWAMPLLRTPSRGFMKGAVIGFTLSMGDLMLPETWHWSSLAGEVPGAPRATVTGDA